MNHLIFVYGTLKQGKSNHRFLSGATFRGRATLGEDYILYVGHLPYLQPTPPGVISPGVVGELYEVDEKILSGLDWLEGHPRMYERTPITVKYGTINLKAETYVYKFKVQETSQVVREFNG